MSIRFWVSYSLGRVSCVMVSCSVKDVMLGAFRHQSCCMVGGSAQPYPSCGSGVGRGRKKSGKVGARKGVGNQCVAFRVRGYCEVIHNAPANHPMLPPVPCIRFPVVRPLLL